MEFDHLQNRFLLHHHYEHFDPCDLYQKFYQFHLMYLNNLNLVVIKNGYIQSKVRRDDYP